MAGNSIEKRYHLVNWPTICMPKSCGGLGILDLEAMNKCLLMKWLWKMENSEGLWQELLHNKYLCDQPLTATSGGQGDSHF